MNKNLEMTVKGNKVALDCESQGLGINSKRAKTNIFNKVVSTDLVEDNVEARPIQKDNNLRIGDYEITPGRVFYKISDAIVADDTESASNSEVAQSVEKLKNLYGKDFSKYIGNVTKTMLGDVPIMDYKTYLNEIQKLLSKRSRIINYYKLKRFRVNLTGGYRTDSVVVVGKPGCSVILNVTVYRNGEFIKSIDYDLEELYKHAESLGM